jgi:hypothetical protein
MKLDLPPWTQSPFVIVPFFAVCVSIPILIGISDRAAAFAGGLFSAMAAVIAVLAAAYMQRQNERAREHREYASNMRAMSLELALHLSILRRSCESTAEQFRYYWIHEDNHPTSKGILNAYWRELIEMDIPPLSNRIEKRIWNATPAVAERMSELIRSIAKMKRDIADQATYPPDKPLDGESAPYLQTMFENIVTLTKAAESAVQTYRDEIDKLLND